MLELLVTLLFLIFIWLPLSILIVKRPRRRKSQVLKLLKRVMRHKGNQQQWQLFLATPLLGQNQLEQARLACACLEADYGTGFERHILAPEGVTKLGQLIAELENTDQISF